MTKKEYLFSLNDRELKIEFLHSFGMIEFFKLKDIIREGFQDWQIYAIRKLINKKNEIQR